jgi:hypothetical protein
MQKPCESPIVSHAKGMAIAQGFWFSFWGYLIGQATNGNLQRVFYLSVSVVLNPMDSFLSYRKANT